jgi:microsomal dipeptidase-like Zn-dependent dipeptidase
VEMNRLGKPQHRLGNFPVKASLADRLGMIVDLSHVTPNCAVRALELTRAPVMFSHSNAQAVFDCPGNIPDHILDLVPKNGGVVMVNFVPEHVAENRRVPDGRPGPRR